MFFIEWDINDFFYQIRCLRRGAHRSLPPFMPRKSKNKKNKKQKTNKKQKARLNKVESIS